MARFWSTGAAAALCLLSSLVPVLATTETAEASYCPPGTHFNLTAIATYQGKSIFQCWQLTDPMAVSTTAGIAGAAIQELGNLGAAEYGFLPANFPGVPHPAPFPQYVVFLSGSVNITNPDSHETHIFVGGKHGILFAADTADKSKNGHISTVLGQNLESITVPLANGTAPPHRVLHSGVCRPEDLNL